MSYNTKFFICVSPVNTVRIVTFIFSIWTRASSLKLSEEMCLIPFFKKSTWRSDIAWKMNRTIANKKKIREIPSNSLNYFVTQFLVWIFLCWSWFLGKISTQRFTKNWTLDTFLSKFFIFWISFGIRSVCQYCGEHFGVRNKLPKLSTFVLRRWVMLGPSQSRTVYSYTYLYNWQRAWYL